MTLIGWLGVVFITCCSIPQLIKIKRTKKSRDVSVVTYILLVLGIACYLVYAIYIKDVVFITSNTIGLISNGTILALLLRGKYGS